LVVEIEMPAVAKWVIVEGLALEIEILVAGEEIEQRLDF
jgi:hypothetical protein